DDCLAPKLQIVDTAGKGEALQPLDVVQSPLAVGFHPLPVVAGDLPNLGRPELELLDQELDLIPLAFGDVVADPPNGGQDHEKHSKEAQWRDALDESNVGPQFD